MFTTIVSFGLAIYLVFGVLVYGMQRNMIYFPTPPVGHSHDTELIDNKGYPVSTVVVNAGREHGLLYFGGNGEAVAQNGDGFAALFPRHTAYLVHYRGYGGSGGSPSEAAIYDDALAVFDAIRGRHATLTVVGRSLGSGVATFLAVERALDRLVLVTPFDSVLNVARQQLPLYPINLLLKDRYDSIGRAGQITAPTLVLVAEHDEVIPGVRSQALLDTLNPELTTSHTLPGAGHNDISLFPRYEELLAEFVNAAGGD